MYGIIIHKEYAKEIFNGERTSIAWPTSTKIKGRVAIIDSRTRDVLGTAEVTGCRWITAQEYVALQQFTSFPARALVDCDVNKTYYACDLTDTVRFLQPLSLSGNNSTQVKTKDFFAEIHFLDTTSIEEEERFARARDEKRNLRGER